MRKVINNMPPQQLPFNKKTKEWRKKCVDFADSKSLFNYTPVRNSVRHKIINYDLLQGKLHMSDLEVMLNPENVKGIFISDKIPHYPIMNTKLDLLVGEESKRVFEYKVIVTDPNSISEIENAKKEQVYASLQQLIAQNSQDEEQFNQQLEEMGDYFTYEWQDMREIRANSLLNHYVKEQNFPLIFNTGFVDCLAVGEEIYQCDIVGGEPVLTKLNPIKVRVFRSGYSNKIEDADMIILEDYWSPGRIIDTYGEVLTEKDRKYIENLPYSNAATEVDDMGFIDPRGEFVNEQLIDDTFESSQIVAEIKGDAGIPDGAPYDAEGNIRVLRVYWKSRRKIKKVKSYDLMTGDETYTLYPETYICNKELGEEEQIFWINEAWEGTKIGEEIYVNMRPRPIQYNRLGNPSRCHFGIVGTIYNTADGRPFSLVDRMKQYNYMYDVIHYNLSKMIANNWGKLVRLDLAKVPDGWEVKKWMYFARSMGLAVENSYNEGKTGAATGVLAGGMNNATSGVIDAEIGNSIQMQINLLEFIKMEMSEVTGITKQREGQISNRETVGGVERATLQSSHITESIFMRHEDTKRRVLDCFLETTKIALKGNNTKFQYLLSDGSQKVMSIDGDEYAECDYGILVDNSNNLQELSQKIDMLAQAAVQNGTSLSTIMKMYMSNSFMERVRMLQKDEEERKAQEQQQLQMQQEQVQQQIQAQMQAEQTKNELQDAMNQRDNETKILVATINAQSKMQDDGIQEPEYSQEAKDKLLEQIREFDSKMKLDRDKFNFEKQKTTTDQELKRKQINKQSNNKK